MSGLVSRPIWRKQLERTLLSPALAVGGRPTEWLEFADELGVGALVWLD